MLVLLVCQHNFGLLAQDGGGGGGNNWGSSRLARNLMLNLLGLGIYFLLDSGGGGFFNFGGGGGGGGGVEEAVEEVEAQTLTRVSPE